MSEPFIVNMVYGSVKLVQTQSVQGSKIYLGGFAIHLDRDGKEVSRSENTWNVILDCGSEEEAVRLAKTRVSVAHGG